MAIDYVSYQGTHRHRHRSKVQVFVEGETSKLLPIPGDAWNHDAITIFELIHGSLKKKPLKQRPVFFWGEPHLYLVYGDSWWFMGGFMGVEHDIIIYNHI